MGTLHGGAEYFAERVSALTGGRFRIVPSPAGKFGPGTAVPDLVAQGAVPIGHTAAYYAIGKAPVTGDRYRAALRHDAAPNERLVL
ncbi:MAG: hypothetical protein NZ532_00680 [Thermoflexales bacterium]|nr:hypothetical protein [Thermoflexales bacterium]